MRAGEGEDNAVVFDYGRSHSLSGGHPGDNTINRFGLNSPSDAGATDAIHLAQSNMVQDFLLPYLKDDSICGQESGHIDVTAHQFVGCACDSIWCNWATYLKPLGAQQQLHRDWLFSADGIHVFGERKLIGHLLRSTTSTSPDVQCPGNNGLCLITDPVTGITDSVTELDSSAKNWYDETPSRRLERPADCRGHPSRRALRLLSPHGKRIRSAATGVACMA